MDLYLKTSIDCSRITTRNYSTSFSLGILMLKSRYRDAIYSIYGFVRFADEIVDTFFEYRQRELLQEFREQTYEAIKQGISMNPVLNSFQYVVNKYHIDHQLIDAFLDSMEMDLDFNIYDEKRLKKYIYGSAEVVGLMCLRVFYPDDDKTYQELTHPARKLGEVFQKVNFLRDIKDDYQGKGRIYFKDINFSSFDKQTKQKIEDEIEADFKEAFQGIIKLHRDVRLGVYLAYLYYRKLFEKIKRTAPNHILKSRLRVPGFRKMTLLFTAYARHTFGLII
jgi:15-cis-phytoene synthase